MKPNGKKCGCAVLAFACILGADHRAHSGTPSVGPDVIVGELFGDTSNPNQVRRWGKVGSITGYSVGTISCNIGDAPISWIQNSPNHPVIGGQIYRLKDGRFEQIGLTWVKHGFLALDEELCSGPGGCHAPPVGHPDWGKYLFPGCSDPYSAQLNGSQQRLGPRSEINPSTGAKPFPYAMIGISGDNIYKRLQIADADLDPALNSGADYFVEGEYITADDATAGNQGNNVSYRELTVVETTPGVFELTMVGPTMREQSAIMAWAAADSNVAIESTTVAGDGTFMLANNVTDLGNGEFAYEYALYNRDSHRSAGAIQIPLGLNVTPSATGFHDVHYHDGDGEPFGATYSGLDWAMTTPAGFIQWSTESYATNIGANALRWGTIYNFRFVANTPPKPGLVTVGLFRPGTPSSFQIAARVPDDFIPDFVLGDMNVNGAVDMPDVPLFVALILDPDGAEADQQLRGDMNEDTIINAFDISMFVASLAP